MQITEIFEQIGGVISLIVIILFVFITVCGIAGQFWDIHESWRVASDREKKWTKICCGSCTLFLLAIVTLLLLSLQ
ncbi:hypothetical protein EU545_05015 [Candidatus Thorarchaeota archaeon]|nr:MAG: hypothetical protein EU545_05015 [Candidatus Thorarchaeota archaeon]